MSWRDLPLLCVAGLFDFMNPPAFQLYADDFLSGTSEMTAEEVGAYIRLLCHQWTKGGLPQDDDRLSRMAGLMGLPMGSPSLRYVVAKFDLCDDGQLRNRRLEAVREDLNKYRQKQVESGKRGAEARWKDGNPIGVAIAPPIGSQCQPQWQPQWQNDGSPPPTPTPTKDIAPASPWIVAFGLELPESLQTENCLTAIKTWLQHKKEKRQAYKPTGLKASLTIWGNEFTSATLPSAVEASIASGWSGIFLPKSQPQQAAPKKFGELDWRDAI
ncbi:MAG: hypothetical protein JW395_3785 [Nitrospira sp.]|nr:hypothetical protein [Nitrospira sp.]